MPEAAKLADLKAGLRGSVIERSDPAYDEVRALYNGMIDKRPLAIARCVDAADVITAVNFGRDNGIPIAIRGGGHNGPGLGSIDNGLVLDLSQMKGVRVTRRRAPPAWEPDAPRATSITPPMRLAWRYRPASSRRRVSPD